MAIWAASPAASTAPFFGRRPQDLVLHGQLPDLALRLPQCPVIGRSVGPLPLQAFLAALQEVVAPGRQPVCLNSELPRQRLEGSPRSNLSTASIFLPADGCTPARRRVLEASGWGELHEQLYLLSVRGRWAEMGRLVDEVLDACAVRGQPEQIPARLWPATARCATGSPSPPPAAGAGRTLGGGGRASPAAAARAVSGGLPRRDDRDGRGLLPAEPGAVDSDAHADYLLCLP
jgi:hypothetical protein